MRTLFFFLAFTVMAQAQTPHKCKGVPDVLNTEWVADCEAYYRSGNCVTDMKGLDARSKLANMFCTSTVRRIDLFKENSPK